MQAPADRARQIIAVAVVRHQGQVLIGRRGPDVPLAGMWEFPGGKVHAGETPAAAARRECREETGLVVDCVGRLSLEVHDYDYARLELHFFDCQLLVPAEPPRPPFCWVPIGEIDRYEFPAANRELVARLVAESSPRSDA